MARLITGGWVVRSVGWVLRSVEWVVRSVEWLVMYGIMILCTGNYNI